MNTPRALADAAGILDCAAATTVLFDGRGPIDGVLFDIDDTLVNTRAAFATAMNGIAAVYLTDLPTERYEEVLTMWRSDPDGHYRSYTRGELTLVEQRLLRANQLQEAFGGAELTTEEFSAWDAVFEETFQAGWAAHADAVPTIAGMSALGLEVGALSNAPTDYQALKLARTGLAHVPMLVGLDTLGVGKPDPRVFIEACARLGTEPARTVYVGDELDLDARAAVAAGLFGVWIDRPGTRRGGVHVEDPTEALAEGVVVVSGLAELDGLCVPAA